MEYRRLTTLVFAYCFCFGLASFCVLFFALNSSVSAEQSSNGSSSPTYTQSELLSIPRDGRPLVIKAGFYLTDINEIDDEGENFEFTGTLVLSWKDSRQAFNPKIENVEEKTFVGGYQFDEISPAWYPQVLLVNESGQFEKHNTLLRIKPDGTSTLIETIDATAEVSLSMRRYPFDSHRLEAVFAIYGFDTDEVVLETDPALVSQSVEGIDLSQWQVSEIQSSVSTIAAPYAGKRGVSSTFNLRVSVARESLFALRLIVLPLSVIVMLSWSIFWMERSSLGDRINVSFIGILTAVAYQIVVGDIMPHISYVTFMNAFINISFAIMCAGVMINLVVGHYDKQGKTALGDRIDFRCRLIFPLVYFGLLISIFAIAQIFFD